MNRCPACGQIVHAAHVPSTTDPYELLDLPTRFRLNGTAVEIVDIKPDDTTGTTNITVRQLLL
ncbi:hypothetical protein [Telmatospirillum sp.]|uniref:hypothetical protein n=1 Tax=Telmatospirillum sp. TaxID=2079197 RepID=UPI00284BE80D|nr:hypothetical protein [Telmatospirillum sp.]MDR3436420.1 hypothetical protein [Telmatospirillum sp.]